MLEQLTIRNFQVHRKFVLDLSPAVTVLTGQSDRGKSAVLRALRWCCLNKPQGEAFLREGQEHVSVRLKADGHEVLRERCPGLNAYSLDGHRFQAFGSDVPPEIASLLNLSELGFARQHDAPFWLSLSPGQVSRELNAVVDLEVIDSALTSVASAVRSARSEAEVSEKRLAQAREERDRLAWAKEASADLGRMDKLDKDLSENRLKRSRISNLLLDGERVVSEGDRLSEAILDGLLGREKGEAAISKASEAENLREILEKCTGTEEKRCQLEKSLAGARKELEGLLEGLEVCPLCGGEIPSPSPS